MAGMDWLLIALGASGMLTLRHYYRVLVSWFVHPPVAKVHFSPKGGCTDAVVAELTQARREVLVLAYGFTNEPIAKALVDAKLRGVSVEIVLDDSNEKEQHTDLPFFIEQGLSPLIDSHHAISHNKVMVIDGKTVITGSFNFTHAAEHENAENLLVLKGHGDVAAAYRANFHEHRSHARQPQIQENAGKHAHKAA